ncbi:MAG: metalloregulator ArsR/SmtB family transcription factor [Treponema sp.]|nr:metalloregulator ArsR/SmtB family transcription factor [Treponema sp.]
MNKRYDKYAEIYKALGDINRLMIVDMLTEGELCACKILEKFEISQPTLSHHMKTLCACGLVKGRKQGKWTYYSISAEGGKKAAAMLQKISNSDRTKNETKNKGCDE